MSDHKPSLIVVDLDAPFTADDWDQHPDDDTTMVEVTVSMTRRSVKFIKNLMDVEHYRTGSCVLAAALEALRERDRTAYRESFSSEGAYESWKAARDARVVRNEAGR